MDINQTIYDKPININQINHNYKGRNKYKNVFIYCITAIFMVYLVYMYGLCYVIALLVNMFGLYSSIIKYNIKIILVK